MTLHITMYTKPEDQEKLIETLKIVHDALQNEPKCLYFSVFKSANTQYTPEGTVRVVEIWDTDLITVMSILRVNDWWTGVEEAIQALSIKPNAYDVDVWTGVDGLKMIR